MILTNFKFLDGDCPFPENFYVHLSVNSVRDPELTNHFLKPLLTKLGMVTTIALLVLRLTDDMRVIFKDRNGGT